MRNNILKFTIAIIIVFIITNNFIFAPDNILSWDVFGYYLYLPLKFIYNDLKLSNPAVINSIIEKYHSTSNFYQAMVLPDNSYVMKYSMGMSFFYAPFFLIGHLIAKLSNSTADGFSTSYQYSIFIGSIIYSIIGIWALSNVLLHFFSKTITAFVLIIIVFATNYIVHITMYGQNAMTHNYLFMTYSLIIWLTLLWHESYKLKYMVLLAVICAITILSRPSEIVCLIIPLLWGIDSIHALSLKIKQFYIHKKQLIFFIIILLLFGSFQSIYWKIHTGKFLFYSYGANPGEGFEFATPYITEVLFSFRKGWLIYTPIMIFSIIGFYTLYKRNRSIFLSVIVYFAINLYIVSSWTCWWYAQTFSQRALIPSYPIMAIGMGYFLVWLNEQAKSIKIIIYTIIICLGFLNIFQIIQFHKGIIDGDRMTKDYYFKTFGKMSITDTDKKLLLVNRTFTTNEIFEDQSGYSSRVLKKLDFEDFNKKDTTMFHSGMHSFKMDKPDLCSPAIEARYDELTQKDHAWLKVTAYIYPTATSNNPFSLIIHFTHNNYPYKFIRYDSNKMKLELNKWNLITFYYLTPEVRKRSNTLKVYFLNKGSAPVFIDDILVDVYEKE
ncbi:MAG: hypothetical protein H7141_02490 [Burkholderiales bacterium]|nr:hypothetical protein [Bacteroidia bacterium]